MMQSHYFLSRTSLGTLVVAPLGITGILTTTVLWPALKNPESNIYGSSIGYPSLKRLVRQPIKVQTEPVAAKTLKDSVAAPGESIPLKQVNAIPLVSGTVEQVYVVEGQRVSRGQPLLRIQQSPFEDKVSTARTNLALAEATLKSLPKIYQERLAKLKVDIESAKAKLSIAKVELQASQNVYRERLIELKFNIESANKRLVIAKNNLEAMRSIERSGAISKLQLNDAEETYVTRQNELVSAQQELALAQSGRDSQLKGYLSETKETYITRQNELVSNQQELISVKTDRDKEIETARLTVENSKIALREALRDLNNTVIYASTDGLISRVNIYAGEVANTKTSTITLTQDVVFKAYLDQARLNDVKIGDSATVHLVAYPGKTFQGKVIQLNPTVQTDTVKPGKVGIDRQYTYSAWIVVDDLQMPPGLQGYAQLSQEKASLVIPEHAVTHLSGGEGMVMVAQAGQAVVKRVKLGRIFDNQRQVLEGIKAGEQVVLSPRALNPGDKLKIQSQVQERDKIKARTSAAQVSSLIQTNVNREKPIPQVEVVSSQPDNALARQEFDALSELWSIGQSVAIGIAIPELLEQPVRDAFVPTNNAIASIDSVV